jgi:hypothetical protein
MDESRAAAPPGAIVLVLLALGIALALAFALADYPREFPMTATCPDTLLVTDKNDCSRWESELMTDVSIDLNRDGSCRVCAIRLGPQRP